MRRPKPRTTEFGIRLSSLRESQGLTVSQLAKMTGVSVSYISQLETGRKQPRDSIIRRLSGALDVSTIELFAAAGMIPMPLAETLRPTNATIQLEEDLTEEEKGELLDYLAFLRYRASARVR